MASISSSGCCRIGAGERPDRIRLGRRSVRAGRSRPACTPRTRSTTSAPSSGLVTELVLPAGVRFDTWVDAGTEITPFYDPLIGKLLVHAPTRRQAIAAMAERARRRRGRRHHDEPRSARRRSPPATGSPEATMTTTSLDGVRRRRAARSRCSTAGCSPRCRTFRGASGTGTSASPRRGRWTTGRTASPTRSSATHEGAAALEVTLLGPTIEFRDRRPSIVLGGADFGARPRWRGRADVDRRRRRRREPARARRCAGPGMRGVVAVAGGLRRAATSRAVRRRSCSAASAATAAGRCGPATSSRSAEHPSTMRIARIERARRRTARAHGRLGDRRARRPARRARLLHAGRHRDAVRHGMGGAPQLRSHGGPARSARLRSGRGPTGERPGCTRRTSTTTPTPSARSTSPATCRSCSVATGRASAGSSVRRRSPSAEFWKIGQARAGDTVRFVPLDHDAARSPAPLRRPLAARPTTRCCTGEQRRPTTPA